MSQWIIATLCIIINLTYGEMGGGGGGGIVGVPCWICHCTFRNVNNTSPQT